MVFPAHVLRACRSRSHWNIRVPQTANYGCIDSAADSVGRCETNDGQSGHEPQVHHFVLYCDCNQRGLCRRWRFARMETPTIRCLLTLVGLSALKFSSVYGTFADFLNSL